MTALGEVAEFEMGQAPPGTECNTDGVGTLFVKAGEFADQYPLQREWTTKPLKFGKRGDVFICVVGATAGKLNLGIDCAIGRSVAAIRPSSRLNTKYLYFQLQPWVMKLRAASAGSAQGVINKKQLSEIPLHLPELGEQRRIVAEIEKQFSRLGEAVANLQRVKANLKRYQSSVLAEAFSGSLVPLESTLSSATHKPFESGGDLVMRIARLRGEEKSRPTSQDMPQGWVMSCLGDCFDVVVGATPSRKEAAYWGGGTPWVSSGEVQFGRIRGTEESISDLGLQNSSTKVNPAGSVLLGMIGQGRTRGQAAILDIEAANNQNCAALWVSRTPMPPEFVFYWLMHRYQETRGEGSGNNQQALNKKLVQAIPIPVPPLAEQHRIVAEVDRRLSIVRGVEAEVDANLKRAQALRQAILSKAFAA